MATAAHSVTYLTLRTLYEKMLRRESVNRAVLTDASEPYRHKHSFRLHSLNELHFLDWHAISLLARAERKVTLAINEPASPHVRARTLAEIVSDSSIELDDEERYEPGAVLARFLDLPESGRIWHDYLTSRDSLPLQCRFAGATLDARFPHLRAGFLAGIDLFHAGEYYAAHEEWEALWMRLDEGAERQAAQSLIQLAGAHIHRLKNRPREARKLFLNARGMFLTVDNQLGWLDVPALIEASDFIFDECDATQEIAWPVIPLRNQHSHIARKHR